ncbi:MAG: hypothetical protein PVG97_06210 [Syntrophobacterales bacterium]
MGWEGEPEIRIARRPAVLTESVTMVKLPVRGTRIPDPLEVEDSWVQALSPSTDSGLFLFGGIGFFVGVEAVRKRRDQ